jgi:protein-S-isoprenylcysteine O-methyltransferase Ste14
MSIAPYIPLIFAWIFFGLSHSLLATETVKHAAILRMKENYRYYRVLYSLFATGALGLALYYHLTSPLFLLWQPPTIQIILAEVLIVTGIVIMGICTRKYFMDLSGINAALGKTKHYPLQVTGMNAYVRHPLYTGTLLFVWALFLRYPYLHNLISCVCITAYTYIGMVFEERKLIIEYGEEYKVYQRKVAALVPFVTKN